MKNGFFLAWMPLLESLLGTLVMFSPGVQVPVEMTAYPLSFEDIKFPDSQAPCLPLRS